MVVSITPTEVKRINFTVFLCLPHFRGQAFFNVYDIFGGEYIAKRISFRTKTKAGCRT